MWQPKPTTTSSSRTLIVAATDVELAPILAGLADGRPRHRRLIEYTSGARRLDALTTGVGIAATAAWCSRTLAETRYDFALNVGLCGSFDPSLEPGTVVHIVSDRFAELGAEDGEQFLTVEDLGLEDRTDARLSGELANHAVPANAALRRLPAVRGITVNTVHGAESSIAAVRARFSPQIESMEGAAFMYACLMYDIPFAQVRAVSNVVERRNRSAWRISEAIDALAVAAQAIVAAV
jgi:futalosine hydrolase